jgi:hypothetical protein
MASRASAMGMTLSTFVGGGGRNDTVVSNQCTVFSPKNCFSNKLPCTILYPMMTRRWAHGATRAFQKLWLVGGFTLPDWTRPGSATDLIESATRMGIKAEPDKLSAARGFILMLSLTDRVYAIGGLSDCCQFGNIDVYRGQRWFQSASMLSSPRGDACGGFLEGSGSLSAIVVGGRGLDGTAIGVIEVIGPDDKLQAGRLILDEARYGCVATTAPDRMSITVMGGIGKRSTASTQAMLSSIEIVTAAMSLMTLAPLPNGVASHMALVEAPPFVFIIGGNSLYTSTAVLAADIPPSKQRPINAINVFNRDDRTFANDIVLQLSTARSFASAALVIDDVDRYVIVAGGFNAVNQNTTVVTKDQSIEIINFQIGTRSPTPMPSSMNAMSTTRPPTPQPTPQPTPELVEQEPTAAPCSGADCAVCVAQPRSGPKYCGFNYGASIFSENQGQPVARLCLCELANLKPTRGDAGVLMGMDAVCEDAFFAPENKDCLIAYQQLSCTFYCQECAFGVSTVRPLAPCDRYCQNLRSVCKSMYDIGCQLKVAQIPCARTDEPCARLLPYDINGTVTPLGNSTNIGKVTLPGK